MEDRRRGKYLDSGSGTGSMNMALDEELLRCASAGGGGGTVLRLYTWDPPAVSIGRFQNIETAVRTDACKRQGIDIVRRITGGRAVFHNRELTYSMIARTDDPLFPPDILGTYKKIAAGLLAGLANLGIQAEMVSRSGRYAATVKRNPKEPSCFSSPSWYEILVNGKKIVGSAQRRTPGAFLQHGSILIEYDPIRASEFIVSGAQRDNITCIQQELGRDVSLESIKQAFLLGFARSLGIHFC